MQTTVAPEQFYLLQEEKTKQDLYLMVKVGINVRLHTPLTVSGKEIKTRLRENEINLIQCSKNTQKNHQLNQGGTERHNSKVLHIPPPRFTSFPGPSFTTLSPTHSCTYYRSGREGTQNGRRSPFNLW